MAAVRTVLAPRWLLPLALAFAVVGMHHVPSAPQAPTSQVMAVDTHGDDPVGDHEAPGHDLLHLCLVVLAAAAGVLLAWLLTPVTSGTPSPPSRRPGVRTRSRRAPPAGRTLLTAVCVSRT